ncbi:MAG: hypothetical protein FD153_1534 [Rhodospirillaceae bacterium]|nr:MAG: hypothetical protein FD153_1534 [Rhodospirillaceae bacterium]
MPVTEVMLSETLYASVLTVRALRAISLVATPCCSTAAALEATAADWATWRLISLMGADSSAAAATVSTLLAVRMETSATLRVRLVLVSSFLPTWPAVSTISFAPRGRLVRPRF